MGEPHQVLGEFEEKTLLVVCLQKGEGYGASIRQTLAEATGRNISIGALYSTLDRLERKKLVVSWQGEASPERGGRPKRYFRVTPAGEEALRAAEEVRQRLRPESWGVISPA